MAVPKFLGKRLLFVTAHPDDESYAVAGTIIKNRQLGGQSFLICATLGERGKAYLKKDVSNAALKKIRKAELEKVSRFLGVHKVFSLNLPDTKVEQSAKQLKSKITALIPSLRADYIISFGPDGLTGHKDHITVGKIARQIAHANKIPFITFSAPPSFYQYYSHISQRRKFGKYSQHLIRPKPNLKIKIDGRKKRQAIRLHKSQYDGKNPFVHMPDKVVHDLLNYEYFTI